MGISKTSNFDFSDYNAAVEEAVKAVAILTTSIRMCWIRTLSRTLTILTWVLCGFWILNSIPKIAPYLNHGHCLLLHFPLIISTILVTSAFLGKINNGFNYFQGAFAY